MGDSQRPLRLHQVQLPRADADLRIVVARRLQLGPEQVLQATLIKQSVTGKGHAPKDQVAKMVSALLGLRTPPQADAADALAVATTHGMRCDIDRRTLTKKSGPKAAEAPRKEMPAIGNPSPPSHRRTVTRNRISYQLPRDRRQ